MKAMILAAGFGKRMLPLTARCPKPLLQVDGKPLIVYHIDGLVRSGISDIVINVGHLGHMLIDYIGDGMQFGARIEYSIEPPDAPLETAGGICNALPLLGGEPFLVVNGDIWVQYDFSLLAVKDAGSLLHCVVVPLQPHNIKGDFCINRHGLLTHEDGKRAVFSGISLISPDLFLLPVESEREKLRSWIYAAMEIRQASAELFLGEWMDVGTPERLVELEQHVQKVQ